MPANAQGVIDAILNIGKDIIDAISKFASSAFSGISSAIAGLGSLLSTLFNTLKAGGLPSFNIPHFGNISSVIQSVLGALGKLGQGLLSLAKPIMSSLGSLLTLFTTGAATLGTNPVGWAVALVAAAALLTAALISAPIAIHKFTDSLIESNRALAEVSGSMASVLARADFQNVLRDMRRGEALADSVKGLADANAKLKDRTLGVEVALSRFGNKLGETLTNITEMALESRPGSLASTALIGNLALLGNGLSGLTAIAGTGLRILGLIKDNTDKKDEDLGTMADWLNDVAAEARQLKKDHDPRMARVNLR